MKNKVIYGLIIATGVLFSAAALSSDPEFAFRVSSLATICGISAFTTKFLIKEN